jgi:hypothetical protein
MIGLSVLGAEVVAVEKRRVVCLMLEEESGVLQLFEILLLIHHYTISS